MGEPELAQEEINVPVGPENNIQPGGPDMGQPTHLLPRRNRFVFRVHAPKDFGDKEMIWTLTTHGKSEQGLRDGLRTGLPHREHRRSCRKPARSAPARAIRKSAPIKPPVIEIEGDEVSRR